ncbi:MAG: hypothetical protein K2M19_02725 [Muribaculaceae bacterium]|nr:hypothetical protein [Muribaculaceae bacterium]
MNRIRIIAATVTLLAAALTVGVLHVWHLTAREYNREWPPRHTQDIALVADDETFFDVVTPSPEPAPTADAPAPAPLPVKADNKSTPRPRTGQHTTDEGPAGDAPTVATTTNPSPVKHQTEKPPVKTGPSKEELEQQKAQEEARRRANSATSTAFQRSQGNNNTANNGRTEGDSGDPKGTSTSTHGTGTGTVGGGWQLPRYARVPSTVTGSIKLVVTVGRDGRVRNVTFNGGEPPAAADSKLLAAVKAEVASRRFTRPTGDDAPDQATAYITYRFR